MIIGSYLKSVLEYKFLISVTRALYLREHGCENPWLLFFKTKGVREQKCLGNTELQVSLVLVRFLIRL